MSKMKKRMIGIGIICTMIVVVMIAKIPQENTDDDDKTPNQTWVEDAADGVQESELPESTEEKNNASETLGEDVLIGKDGFDAIEEPQVSEEEFLEEKPYGVLYDVVVTTELTDEDTVKITLTNTSAFAVTKWAVAYESSYDIVTIKNAKLLLNSNKVKQFMALDDNSTLESGDCITITLEIDGTYHSDTRYRVYGSSEGLSENAYVYDLITTHGATGETSLEIYDEEDIVQGPTTTQGLDVN